MSKYDVIDQIIITDFLKKNKDVVQKLLNIHESKDQRICSYIFDKLKSEANNGNKYAQINLGFMYDMGLCIKRDLPEAIKWYKLSANQGLKIAQNNLGYLYHMGFGTKKDLKEAIKWYKLSADQGCAAGRSNFKILLNNNHIILELMVTLINKTYKRKKLLEHLKLLIEHLKLYPGSDFKKAEKDFYLLIKNN